MPWLEALCTLPETALPVVLVTIANAQGSTPRAAGACMLVFPAQAGLQSIDTIGGGHLEMQAIQIAQEMLAQGQRQVHQQSFALGPSLGQCCGGRVQLVWEVVDVAARAIFMQIRARRKARADSWRLLGFAEQAQNKQQTCMILQDSLGRTLAACGETRQPPVFSHAHGHALYHDQQDGLDWHWLIAPVLPASAQVFLFGAGHVGRALVNCLAPLPCHVTWVDERDDAFPASIPANVRCESSLSQTALAVSRPGSYFLVMTHSHALDLDLSEMILRLPHELWFGLIGSQTKRSNFERRLQQRGLDDAQLARLNCPIGLPGIHAKQPEIIAASVCAQLLQLWQSKRLLPQH